MKNLGLHMAYLDLMTRAHTPLKPARGRGNQGDWINGLKRYGTATEHRDWNNEVDWLNPRGGSKGARKKHLARLRRERNIAACGRIRQHVQ